MPATPGFSRRVKGLGPSCPVLQNSGLVPRECKSETKLHESKNTPSPVSDAQKQMPHQGTSQNTGEKWAPSEPHMGHKWVTSGSQMGHEWVTSGSQETSGKNPGLSFERRQNHQTSKPIFPEGDCQNCDLSAHHRWDTDLKELSSVMSVNPQMLDVPLTNRNLTVRASLNISCAHPFCRSLTNAPVFRMPLVSWMPAALSPHPSFPGNGLGLRHQPGQSR